VVCALRVREAASFLVGEGGVFISDRSGGVDVNRRRSSTVRFESADPYIRLS